MNSLLTAMAAKHIVMAVLIFCANAQENSENNISQEILQRIEQLETRDRNQQMELKALRQQNEAMSEELRQVRKQNLEMKHEITRLRKQGTTMLDEIIQLKDKSQQQTKEQKEDKLEKDNDVLVKQTERESSIKQAKPTTGDNNHPGKDNNKTINSITQTTENPNRIRRFDNEGNRVAFFATLSNHTHHLGVHQPVPFDNAITNIGQAYHPSTGIFVAPMSGVYVFSATIFDSGETNAFEFAVNGKLMSRIHLQDTADNDYQTSSQTAIFNLNQGDDVVLRSGGNDKKLHGYHYCSFAGFLLATDLNAINSQIVG